MRLRVLILLGLTLCWPTVGFGFTADKRDTLRGLKEISVLVEYLPDDVEREGLSREHLQRDIEVRLRQAGLHVLTISEVANSPGAPYLYVAVYPITGPSVNVQHVRCRAHIETTCSTLTESKHRTLCDHMGRPCIHFGSVPREFSIFAAESLMRSDGLSLTIGK